MNNFNPYILQLPFPPSINRNWGRSWNGSTYLRKHVKEFRSKVICAHRLASAGRRKDFPITKPVELFIELYYKDGRHTDIDNRLKSLLDALEAAQVFTNDYNVFKITAVRYKPQLHEYKYGAALVRFVAHDQEQTERIIEQ